jgi:hypothetical protein
MDVEAAYDTVTQHLEYSLSLCQEKAMLFHNIKNFATSYLS